MTHYYELRTIKHKPNTTMGAEIARHLAVRQDLGTAVVVTSDPHSMISVVRKTWLHLARQLQKQRAGTLNPEEILRLTHTIMHMQRMKFVAKTSTQVPDAQVYFVTPKQLDSLPPSCFTMYLCDALPADTILKAVEAMPNCATLVNFDVGIAMSPLGLRPKVELESHVLNDWHNMVALLNHRRINPGRLQNSNPSNDEALDTLLNHSHEFLQAANSLRYSIHLAQPITTIGADKQQMFDAVMRLAHRVQSLSPKGFDNYLVRTFGEEKDELFTSYFLRDKATETILA